VETARRARAERARVILTGRNPERLEAALELDAQRTAAFDATDAGAPNYGPPLEMLCRRREAD
jgi:NADP-dependent 3-hydroxy acid dehydrogenase YdfG